ncbi:GNAT family N-acetyltransferase [Acidipropionibacterium jensenii]|uniref:GNAT family N-acetyltransferase n=1 Tax=Acidipropionibacterium jensenii TaxID=1749 RepID=A0A3Q9UIS2_9ACTN|nr:GNAT family N-acetyltransferase [Acidipropionibacterium jensenii]AZZ39132.1 GNAT family N-acetyltransferase [Acidipropionibacterium jensenii]AZZ42476.1 GNAT family N-acetyltransferase [Acidipropionibacterium jensenii]
MVHTPPTAAAPQVHWASLDEIDPVVLYRLLWLRSEVFNGEQHCTDDDLDGRELDPSSRIGWVEVDKEPVATLRAFDEDGVTVLGRLATAADHRGRGLAAALVRRAVAESAGRPVVLHAQAHLQDWYAGLGFALDGEPFMEAGIPHVPMRLTR